MMQTQRLKTESDRHIGEREKATKGIDYWVGFATGACFATPIIAAILLEISK